MASFIQNPIAYGVRSEPGDMKGGPLGQELIAGVGITITPVDVGGGDIKLRISSTGTSANTYISVVDPTAQNDDVDTAGLGRAFEVGEYWLNITSDTLFICMDNTTNAAIWSVVDTTTFSQELVNDNTTKIIVLGNKNEDSAYHINYVMSVNTVRKAGVLYITHNGTVADVRDEFVQVNGIINISATADVAGNDVRLRLQATSVGGNTKFRYFKQRINAII